MSLDSSIFAKEIKLHAPTASVTPVLLDAQLPLFSLYESNFNHGSGLSKISDWHETTGGWFFKQLTPGTAPTWQSGGHQTRFCVLHAIESCSSTSALFGRQLTSPGNRSMWSLILLLLWTYLHCTPQFRKMCICVSEDCAGNSSVGETTHSKRDYQLRLQI